MLINIRWKQVKKDVIKWLKEVSDLDKSVMTPNPQKETIP